MSNHSLEDVYKAVEELIREVESLRAELKSKALQEPYTPAPMTPFIPPVAPLIEPLPWGFPFHPPYIHPMTTSDKFETGDKINPETGDM